MKLLAAIPSLREQHNHKMIEQIFNRHLPPCVFFWCYCCVYQLRDKHTRQNEMFIFVNDKVAILLFLHSFSLSFLLTFLDPNFIFLFFLSFSFSFFFCYFSFSRSLSFSLSFCLSLSFTLFLIFLDSILIISRCFRDLFLIIYAIYLSHFYRITLSSLYFVR